MGVKELRKRIDKVDKELAGLLSRRIGLAKRMGRLKLASGKSLEDAAREEEVLKRAKRLAGEAGLDKDDAVRIFEEIIAACKRVQGLRAKAAFLGPRGTFSEEAVRKRFGNSVETVPLASIRDVFGSVERGEASLGVVPVENSTEGPVGETLDCLLATRLVVVGEMILKVHHCLAAPVKVKVERIYSHPQALAQCRRTLAAAFPSAELIPVASTARAMEEAKRKGGMALGSVSAARASGMRIVRENLEDERSNRTRFLAIARESPRTWQGMKGIKTSAIFSVKHEPGALCSALAPFAKRRVNLTRIESRPARRGRSWEYVFFVDFEGSALDARCAAALRELRELCKFVKVLGSYPAAKS